MLQLFSSIANAPLHVPLTPKPAMSNELHVYVSWSIDELMSQPERAHVCLSWALGSMLATHTYIRTYCMQSCPLSQKYTSSATGPCSLFQCNVLLVGDQT